jgi:hypothetical protein
VISHIDQAPILKSSPSRKPLGKATPKKREKRKKHPTAIPRENRKEKRKFLGFHRSSMAKHTIKVEATNFTVSRISGKAAVQAKMPATAQ